MLHYIDLHLRPDPEFSQAHLLGALYAKLHRALVLVGSNTIGVSFPSYGAKPPTLGNTLRLIGPRADLNRLMEQEWMQGMRDHVRQVSMFEVPASAAHCGLKRVQAKSSPDRLRRRQMRRHDLTLEEARLRVPNEIAESLRLPFVTLASASTGQQFRLFLRLDAPVVEARPGAFNTYGLSAQATTPWF